MGLGDRDCVTWIYLAEISSKTWGFWILPSTQDVSEGLMPLRALGMTSLTNASPAQWCRVSIASVSVTDARGKQALLSFPTHPYPWRLFFSFLFFFPPRPQSTLQLALLRRLLPAQATLLNMKVPREIRDPRNIWFLGNSMSSLPSSCFSVFPIPT